MTEITPVLSTKHVYGIRWEMGKRYLLTWLEFPLTLSDAAVLDQVRLYANLSQAKVTRVFRKGGGAPLLSDTQNIPPEDPARVAKMTYMALKAFVGYQSSMDPGLKFTVKVPWVKDDDIPAGVWTTRSFSMLLEKRALIGPDGGFPDYGIIVGLSIQRKHNASL